MPNTTSGLTNFGTQSKAGGVKCVASKAGFPGVLVLQTYSGDTLIEWHLWVSSLGVLRIGTAYPTNPDTDGFSVGSQP